MVSPESGWKHVDLPRDQVELFTSRLSQRYLAIRSLDRAAQAHFARRPEDTEIIVLSGSVVKLPPALSAAKSLMRVLEIGHRVHGRFLGALEDGDHANLATFRGSLPSPREVLELPQTSDLRRYYAAGYGNYGLGYATLRADIIAEQAALQIGYAHPLDGHFAETAIDLTEPRSHYPDLEQRNESAGYQGWL